MTKYHCAQCGEMAVVPLDTWLDSGTTLTCNHCHKENVIDVETPERRAQRYGFTGGMHVIHIEQPNLDDMCIHQAPGKPSGVPGFMHPRSEPCELREACEARESGLCFSYADNPLRCETHDCSPDHQCGTQECPHCTDKIDISERSR
jgi:hypothetical protein